MRALILAAGYATRLKPLFDAWGYAVPKPLLPLGGKALIDHILEKIVPLSPSQVYVVTNDHFYDHFTAWAKNASYPFSVKIISDGTSSNETRLGAIGDIRYVVEKEKINEDLLVIAGDNYFEFNLVDLKNLFFEKQKTVLALWDSKNLSFAKKKFGVACIDTKNKIINFEEKPEEPKTSLVSTACYIFPREHLSYLSEIQKDNLGELVRHISEKDEVYGCVFPEQWCDIGTPEQYMLLNEQCSKK